ncbi:MAG TPA: methyltransferase domain-containing protein [Bacillota bacterium]|nr:methyltransferase domain-containing protein [Bacillota bacterium]
MSEADKKKWNQKYKERTNDITLPSPTPILKELTPMLHGKYALDIACGLGGNSVYLTQLGFFVTAWDVSDVAIHYLQDLSIKHELAIKTEVKDLDVFLEVNDSFDLVVDTFYLNRPLFPQIKKLVKPGGLFLMHTFSLTDSQANTHISDQYKLQPCELKNIFSEWEILYFNQNEKDGLQSILACKK